MSPRPLISVGRIIAILALGTFAASFLIFGLIKGIIFLAGFFQ